MSTVASAISSGDQAWIVYKDIERVIQTKYSCPINASDTSMALQRLGEAVLSRYQLNPHNHQIAKRWNLTLKHPNPSSTLLSTTKEMLHAKIIEWECAIEPIQAGHDVWTEGRSAGYRLQQSLQETLELPYSEIKLIVDMTPEKMTEIFEQIGGIVAKEISRLSAKDSSQEKILEISKAMQRLAGAIAHKYNTLIPDSANLSPTEKAYVDSIDLYSYNTMLDLKIRKWSLRQALNLSSESLISRVFGLQEALWGKATSLESVEKRL